MRTTCARAGAQTFQRRDRIELLLKVRVHGRRNTDRSDDQGNKTDKAQKSRRSLKPSRDIRIRLAEVRDKRLGEGDSQLLPHDANGRSTWRKFKEQPIRSAASEPDKPRSLQTLARDHHAGADSETARHPVRFDRDKAGDSEVVAADLNGFVRLDFEPDPRVFRQDRGFGG